MMTDCSTYLQQTSHMLLLAPLPQQGLLSVPARGGGACAKACAKAAVDGRAVLIGPSFWSENPGILKPHNPSEPPGGVNALIIALYGPFTRKESEPNLRRSVLYPSVFVNKKRRRKTRTAVSKVVSFRLTKL